jgi:hypothetical protein
MGQNNLQLAVSRWPKTKPATSNTLKTEFKLISQEPEDLRLIVPISSESNDEMQNYYLF